MKLINYNYGYNPLFTCSIHGTIEMNREDFGKVVNYLYQNAGTISKNNCYFNPQLLREDLGRREYIKNRQGTVKAFLINIRVGATEALVKHFSLKGYKRGNYQLRVLETD